MDGNNMMQYQSRKETITNRDVLDQVVDDVCQNEAEKQALSAYKSLCDIQQLENETYITAQRIIEILPVTSNEFKFYKRYRKYIEEHLIARNEELKKLESDEHIKNPLNQAWKIFREQERKRSNELLENWRKNKEIESAKAKKQSEEIQARKVQIQKNYKKIDDVLSSEKNFKIQCSRKIEKAKEDSRQEIRKNLRFICITWAISITILTLLFYVIFPFGSFFPHLTIATFITTFIALYFIIKNIQETIQRLFELKEKYNDETKKEIVTMYHLLFDGVNLYEFLDVPNNVVLDSYKSLPKDKNLENNSQFGTYTRYISPYGSKYHIDYGCSTATIPAHLFSLKDKEACSRCIKNENFTLPNWYVYLKKLQPVIEQYPFLFDLSIKPYD